MQFNQNKTFLHQRNMNDGGRGSREYLEIGRKKKQNETNPALHINIYKEQFLSYCCCCCCRLREQM